jgi:hypothetical protein
MSYLSYNNNILLEDAEENHDMPQLDSEPAR